jgi:hypothetical protein
LTVQVGFNYAFSREEYGLQIGPFPPTENWTEDEVQWKEQRRWSELSMQWAGNLPRTPVFRELGKNLAELKSLGISVVRWFILCDGFNYGYGPTRKLRSDGDIEWSFDPPSRVDPRFPTYFAWILAAFRAAKLQIIPSLIDFGFVGNSTQRNYYNFARGGRAECLTDPTKRGQFLNGIFASLLLASRAYPETIYAWEIVNEPEWMVLPNLKHPDQALWGLANSISAQYHNGHLLHDPLVRMGELSDFLRDGLALVKQSGFKSTVGFRYHDQWTTFPGGTNPQFHYYAKPGYSGFFGDPASIPQFTGDPKPILGEFASQHSKYNVPWPDLAGKTDTTLERLKLLESRGCELCLFWPDFPAPKGTDGKIRGDPIKLAPETKRQIKTYTGAP